MKVVVYSAQPFEKEPLAKANQKKHDITLISNSLNEDTIFYAKGKDAVIVSATDEVNQAVIKKLENYHVKYISTRTFSTHHIDMEAAKTAAIKVGHLPAMYLYKIAQHALTLVLALNNKIQFLKNRKSLSIDLTKKSIRETTIGVIGFGDLGQLSEDVFKSFGYNVIAHHFQHCSPANINQVDLDELFAQSDVIALHLPVIESNKNFINKTNIAKMKDGVMLIDTSKINQMNVQDVVEALNSGKISFVGVDVYEHHFSDLKEKAKDEEVTNPHLNDLLTHPHAVIVPYREFLTSEIIQEIAEQTIKNLDHWQETSCFGKNCSGTIDDHSNQ